MVCKAWYSFGAIVCHHSEGSANMGLQQHKVLIGLCVTNYRYYDLQIVDTEFGTLNVPFPPVYCP